MASLYDAILVKGNMRPRLNKNFVSPEKVPKVVMDVLTVDNIVDENGLIVVDQKNDAAKQPTDENREELGEDTTTPEEPTSLPRVDQSTPENPEQTPTEQAAPPAPASEPQAPVAIDDSANENQTPQEGVEDAVSTSNQTAPDAGPAPVAQTVATQPEQPAQPAPAPAPQAQVPAEPERTAPAPVAAPVAPAPAAAPAPVAEEPVERFRSKVPQSTPGMGFPRKNGKTVDIFDLTTPHTHTKLVGGLAVPLSAESFKTRGEAAIQRRLQELGIETMDFEQYEREQAMNGVADPSLLMEDNEDDEDIMLG